MFIYCLNDIKHGKKLLVFVESFLFEVQILFLYVLN